MKRRISTLLREAGEWFDRRDPLRTAACYLEAAQRGSAEGAYWMGLMYVMDIFKEFPPDDRLAARFFAQAADLGHAESQARIADMYANGCGVVKDREKANRYWLAAAQSGDPDWQWMYAMFLFFDAPDSERGKNVRAAKKWLRAAQRNGAIGVSIAMREIARWEDTGVLRDQSVDIEQLFNWDDEPDDEEDDEP